MVYSSNYSKNIWKFSNKTRSYRVVSDIKSYQSSKEKWKWNYEINPKNIKYKKYNNVWN